MPNENSPPDFFEFLQKMWNPAGFGFPMPGMITPSFDTEALDKKINELKSVENWMKMNLNVLQMTIQGLEVQKATLSALSSLNTSTAQEKSPDTDQESEESSQESPPASATSLTEKSIKKFNQNKNRKI